jgi:hypothetical protein
VAATGVTRYTKRAMTLGGCYLPAGTMIIVPFYAVRLQLHEHVANRAALRLAWPVSNSIDAAEALKML